MRFVDASQDNETDFIFFILLQDSRAYAAWLKEQRLYYSGGRNGDRQHQDDEFYPHGELFSLPSFLIIR